VVMNIGQVRPRVGVLAPSDQGQAAVAVGQCLGGPADLLPGPGGLGQRAPQVMGEGLAMGVDLARGFPLPADRGVGQPSVVGRHRRGVMIQDFLDHVLGDIPVDQPGPEGYLPWPRRNPW
jgi:hypothetical protein